MGKDPYLDSFIKANNKDIDRKRRIALNIQMLFSSIDVHWFICFGTLLSFIRDRKLNLDGDIDIGIIEDIEKVHKHIKNQHEIDHLIRSDKTGKLLNFSYRDINNDITIDVFNWINFKGMYWHTFDTLMDFPKNGIPSKYIFKSMPENVFITDKRKIAKYQNDLKYGRQMTNHGTWKQAVPEFPNDGIELCLPYNYGYFLDIAYPDWFTTRDLIGTSQGYTKMEVNTCRGIC
ncbi:MAG: hypothetical protein GY861_12750 [bacterium]|nr:hypothetical protein [bacterium]